MWFKWWSMGIRHVHAVRHGKVRPDVEQVFFSNLKESVMRVRLNSAIVALIACVLLATASVANATLTSVGASNLFQGKTVTSSSDYSGDYVATKATDGQPEVSDWVSSGGDSNPRLVVSGLDGTTAIGTIRLWSNTDIPVRSVTIWSSTTNQTSLTASSYEASLVTTKTYDNTLTGWTHNPDYPNGTGDYYIDYAVNAPAGTQSVLVDFGSMGWVRVEEIQGFASVPEPATMILLVTGLFGMLAYAWRKRK
jgi:hypothetical protein